jgi:hypothetical protein
VAFDKSVRKVMVDGAGALGQELERLLKHGLPKIVSLFKINSLFPVPVEKFDSQVVIPFL